MTNEEHKVYSAACREARERIQAIHDQLRYEPGTDEGRPTRISLPVKALDELIDGMFAAGARFGRTAA